MGDMNFLNAQYLVYRAYEAFINLSFVPTNIPHDLAVLIEDITLIGMVLSVVFIVLIVYVRTRLLQVEHGGFHHMEEEERRRHAAKAHVGSNTRWDNVVALASSGNESDWRRAIMEADVLLAAALSARGIPGETVGDQLKNANPMQFHTLDLAWEAHKMRNTIAHLGEAFPLSARDTQATIDLYRRVLEEFGVI